VVHGVFGSAVVVGVGRCSERGLPGLYVHLRRHFLVGVSSGMVWPRRSLANLGRLWAGGALACAILELESVSWSSYLRLWRGLEARCIPSLPFFVGVDARRVLSLGWCELYCCPRGVVFVSWSLLALYRPSWPLLL
jgi:hypothetical protein